MEIKYLVVPEVDPKKVSFSYQLFLDDFVRVCVTSDFRVWTSTKWDGLYILTISSRSESALWLLGATAR